jgi:Flp pilus assembly pilin Flp
VTEYAVILAGIAVVCVVAALFVGATIKGRFDSTGTPTPAAPFTPPRPTPAPQLTYPTRLEECSHGGWRDFPQFASEAECRNYVDGLEP